MRPREGHRGHLKGRMMFLWSHLYDGTLHPLAFGTLSSGSHSFGCYLMRKKLAIHYFHARLKILNSSLLYSHAY